jgi:hypothetical protein
MMKNVFLVSMVAIISLLIGFLSYPFIYQQSPIVANPDFTNPVATNCEINTDQLDSMAAHLAPSVVKQLISSGVTISSEITVRSSDRNHENGENKDEQAQAFLQATEKIDQMIASRQVTTEGINQAYQLLEKRHQSHRAHELMGRISVAINKGELSPSEAGIIQP